MVFLYYSWNKNSSYDIYNFFSLCHNVLKFQTNTVALEEVQASLLLNWFKLVDDNDLRAVMKKFWQVQLFMVKNIVSINFTWNK